MEKSKILLEKTEVKKISKRYKLDMLEKESGKLKSKAPDLNNLPKKRQQAGISPETYHDLIDIYPNNAEIINSRNQQTYKNNKKHEKCELSARGKSNSSGCQFKLSKSKPSCETASSSSSVSSISSFVFLETESSVDAFNYDKLTEDSDATLKEESDGYLREQDTESVKKLLCNSSNISFYGESTCESYASQEDIADDKMNIKNSARGEEDAVESRYLDKDEKIDDKKNSVDLGQGSTLSLTEEDNELKELRDVLEKSTNCFLRYLKSLQNAVSKRETSKKSLRKDNNIEFDYSTPEYNCGDTDLKTLKVKRDNNSSHGILPESCILKSKSDTDAKKRTGAVVRVSRSPRSIHTDTTTSECFPCDCRNRKCFHFESTRRVLSNDVLEVSTKSKKKMTTSMSQGDFAKNLIAADTCMKIPGSTCVNGERCRDLSILAGKEAKLVQSDTGLKNALRDNCRLIHQSNVGETNQSFEFCSATPKETNLIKNTENEGNRNKNKKKAKVKGIYRDSDQCKKIAEKDDGVDNDVDWDIATQLFLAFLFVMCILFFFIFFMFIFTT